MDFEKYRFRVNIKACCLYEQMTGKNFFKLATNEDLLEFLYSCLIVSNDDLLMTFDVFMTLMKDVKVAKWVNRQYDKVMTFMSQFKGQQVEEEQAKKEEESEEEIFMTNVATSLIIRYGVDAHYVMTEMELWEIKPYLTAADNKKKGEMVEQRFWTYLTIMPNMNTKKVKSPEELIPFEWEKEEKKKKAEETLKNNMYAIKNTLGRSIDDILNGR